MATSAPVRSTLLLRSSLPSPMPLRSTSWLRSLATWVLPVDSMLSISSAIFASFSSEICGHVERGW